MLENAYTTVFFLQSALFFLLFVLIHLPRIKDFILEKRNFKFILIGLFLLFIAMAALLGREVGDVRLFSSAGRYLRKRIDFYWIDKDHMQYPFFPFLIFYHSLANWIVESTGLFTFSFYLKLLMFVALFAISLFIKQYNLTKNKKDKKQARLAQLKFLLSPITYFTVVFHGQTDILLLAFLVYSLYFLFSQKDSLKNLFLGSILFAASIATKTWSVLLLPLTSLKLKKIYKMAVLNSVIIVFLLFIIYLYTRIVFGSSFEVVTNSLSSPGGPVGIWGLSFIFNRWQNFIKANNLYIFTGLFALGQLLIINLKRNIWEKMFLTILLIYLIIPNWGIQYLMWVQPFLFILYSKVKTSRLNLYVILGGIFSFLNYTNVAFDRPFFSPSLVNLVGLILWLFIGYWFVISINKRTDTIDKKVKLR
jgi:hypothetical protein